MEFFHIRLLIATSFYLHQSKQTDEVGIMPETEICRRSTFLYSNIRTFQNIAQQRHSTARHQTAIERSSSITHVHASIHRLPNTHQLLVFKDIIERQIQLYILHIGSNPIEAAHHGIRISYRIRFHKQGSHHAPGTNVLLFKFPEPTSP